MGKAAGYSGGRTGSSAVAGSVGRGYSFGRPSSGVSMATLWENAMKASRAEPYKRETKKLKPYELMGGLERSAYLFRERVGYDGKRQLGLYSGSAEKGDGILARTDAYPTPNSNIINLADYRAGMLDNAYRKINSEGYQPNFQYKQAA